MEQFNELRELARAKRDDAIKAARATYQSELDQINDLELRLKPRKPSQKGKPKPAVNELALKKSLRSAMRRKGQFAESDGLWTVIHHHPKPTS